MLDGGDDGDDADEDGEVWSENTWEEERTGQGWCSLRSSAKAAPSRAQDLQDLSSTLERREYQQLSNTNMNTWWN